MRPCVQLIMLKLKKEKDNDQTQVKALQNEGK